MGGKGKGKGKRSGAKKDEKLFYGDGFAFIDPDEPFVGSTDGLTCDSDGPVTIGKYVGVVY